MLVHQPRQPSLDERLGALSRELRSPTAPSASPAPAYSRLVYGSYGSLEAGSESTARLQPSGVERKENGYWVRRRKEVILRAREAAAAGRPGKGKPAAARGGGRAAAALAQIAW